jgi:pyruvate carboxylase
MKNTTKPIRKLLAANRSEIAIRIFRAATDLGLRTVGIYSQEDRLGLHRFKADEAYQVGIGKGPVEAYLDIAGIVALATQYEVDAIHPGYGFLSENPAFARACEKAGITFVGPTPALLELLGDKTAARRLAASAGIPTLPGTENSVKSATEAQKIAKEIGRNCRRCSKKRRARPAPRSAMPASSWKSICRVRATWKCKFWRIIMATYCICTNAIVRCSAATRKW